MRAWLLYLLAAAGCGGNSGNGEETKPPPAHPGAEGESGTPARLGVPGPSRPAATAVAEGSNRFALDLYREVKQGEGNRFFSPLSISIAFAMVHAGAAGETRDEMTKVFHFPDSGDLHPGFQALARSLESGTRSGNYRLDIANRLWGAKGYAFLPEYIETTRNRYGAALEQVDFGNAEGARKTINRWVAKKTEDKIPELLPSGVIHSLTRLVLTNAVYFKGDWRIPFRKGSTRDEDFHLGSGRTVSVPMMHRTDEFSYGRERNLQLLRLPYAKGDLSMVVILPDSLDGLPDVEARLQPDSLRAWMGRTTSQDVIVTLPRFRFRSSFLLKDTLSRMGMPHAFGDADFSGMTEGEDLHIGQAVHQAYVEVNEEGTEAAAATGVMVDALAMPADEPSRFRADHPFLFLIWDEVTGSILFLGRVADPSA